MIRGDCHACGKPLTRPPVEPVVMDRDGQRYHFACWGRVMDERRAAELGRETKSRPPAVDADVSSRRPDLGGDIPGH